MPPSPKGQRVTAVTRCLQGSWRLSLLCYRKRVRCGFVLNSTLALRKNSIRAALSGEPSQGDTRACTDMSSMLQRSVTLISALALCKSSMLASGAVLNKQPSQAITRACQVCCSCVVAGCSFLLLHFLHLQENMLGAVLSGEPSQADTIACQLN